MVQKVDQTEITAWVDALSSSSAKQQGQAAAKLKACAAASVENKIRVAAAGAILPLVALLESDNVSVQEQAVHALRELAWNHQTRIIHSGAVRLLTGLCSSPSTSVQHGAAGALANLAWRIHREAPVMAVRSLVRLLSSSALQVQEQAACALRNLAWNVPPMHLVIHWEGGVKALLGLLSSNSQPVRSMALGAVRNISSSAQNSRADNAHRMDYGEIVELIVRAMEPVTTLLKSKSDDDSKNAAWIIANMGCFYDQAAILGELAIPTLVKQLANTAVRYQAVRALAVLAKFRTNNEQMVKAGVFAPLMYLLSSSSGDILSEALDALHKVSQQGELYQSFNVARSPSLKPLVSLLASSDRHLQEKAFQTLFHIAESPATRMVFVSPQEMSHLVSLLATKEHVPESTLEWALRILAVLARLDTLNLVMLEVKAATALNRLLTSPCVQIMDMAASVLTVVCSHGAEIMSKTSAHWLIPSQVALLANGASECAGAYAATILASLAPFKQTEIARSGAVPYLVRLLRSSQLEFRESALRTLAHLDLDAWSGDRGELKESLPFLVALLSSRQARDTPMNAAMAVCALAKTSAKDQVALAKEGAVPPLVVLLGEHRAYTDTHRLALEKKYASFALGYLSRPPANKAAMESSGAIPPLLSLIRAPESDHEEVPLRKFAVFAMGHVISAAPCLIDSCSPAIPVLVSMLLSRDKDAQTYASLALSCLASKPAHHSSIISSGGVPALGHLLSCSSGPTLKLALDILGALARNPANSIDLPDDAMDSLQRLCLSEHEDRTVLNLATSALIRLRHMQMAGGRFHGQR